MDASGAEGGRVTRRVRVLLPSAGSRGVPEHPVRRRSARRCSQSRPAVGL